MILANRYFSCESICERSGLSKLISLMISLKITAMKKDKEKGKDYFTKETIQNARTLFCFWAEVIDAKYNFKNNK